MESHFAMIGTAFVMDGYPLYYEAVNEKGLGMAGLNFEGNAHYFEPSPDKDNITPFEFIPWILGQRGLCDLGDNKYEITIYTSCYNTRTGVQYYNCYDNHQISKVDMHKEDLDGRDLARYPLITSEQIFAHN